MDAEAYQAVAQDLWEEHAPASHKNNVGPFAAGGLAKIIAWLRANGITFSKIVSLIGPIITAIISGGGNWMAILSAIWAIFFPNTPLPISGLPAA